MARWALLCAGQIATLVPATLLPLPPIGFIVLAGFWSVFCWAFMVPQQARLAAPAPPLTPVLFALNAASIYHGGSIGSFAGGITLHHAGFSVLGPAGAILVLAAIASLAIVNKLGAAGRSDGAVSTETQV